MSTETGTPGAGEEYCPHCRAVIASRAEICPECGSSLERETATGTGPPTRGESGTDPGMITTVVSGVCLAIAVLMVFLGLLVGLFWFLSMGAALVGAVIGAVGYWQYGSTASAALGGLNLLVLLGEVALLVLLILLFGLVLLGSTTSGAGTLLPAAALVFV